jgi:hypothetical protein
MITTGLDGALIRRTTNVFVFDGHGNWIEKTDVETGQCLENGTIPRRF